MNTENLMINDWVEATNSDHLKYVQVGTIFNDSIITREAEYESEEIDIKDLQPISLTPEILEKNNDILHGELPILFDDGKMHYSIVECRYVSKEYDRNNETFYCLLSSCAYNGGSFVTPFAKIRYVHELQHAFKLCGIEKEIIL